MIVDTLARAGLSAAGISVIRIAWVGQALAQMPQPQHSWGLKETRRPFDASAASDEKLKAPK
jgi:hypothetical protein